jgi:hypothetical protein
MPKHDQVEEVLAPDFEKMKRIFQTDLKPANEQNAKSRGDLSAAWGAIEKDCHVNKRAAKLLFRLSGESEEARDDFLSSALRRHEGARHRDQPGPGRPDDRVRRARRCPRSKAAASAPKTSQPSSSAPRR